MQASPVKKRLRSKRAFEFQSVPELLEKIPAGPASEATEAPEDAAPAAVEEEAPAPPVALVPLPSPVKAGRKLHSSAVLDSPGSDECQCPGCHRWKAWSISLFTGLIIEWARGFWCKDCMSIWRTLYTGSRSHSLFVVWIQETANAREWAFSWLAYASLCLERPDFQGPFKCETLVARRELFMKLEHTFGLFFLPCQIKAIQSFAAGETVPREKLIQVHGSDGSFVGAIVDQPPVDPNQRPPMEKNSLPWFLTRHLASSPEANLFLCVCVLSTHLKSETRFASQC